jgi:glycosyltransferase involved in cell wall biosynthesis
VAYGSGIEENVASLAARIWLAPFFAVFILRALGAAKRADVVISNWLVPAGAAGALCRMLLARPHLAIEHGGALWALRGRGWTGRLLLAGILRATDRAACVSAALRDDLLTEAAASGVRLRARDVALIPMGIEARLFAAPGRRRDIDVLYLGRLIAVKGVETLIDAAAGIPGATLVIAGDGPREAALRARAAPLRDRVRFAGLIHGAAKRELLARAAILAVPSVILSGGRTEGFPAVVLEGMASGCAVVASDVGGIGEVLRDGWNGFLSKPGDATALAERIRWILDHPSLRDAIGDRAAGSVAAFDASAVGDRIAAEIDRLLPGDGRIR